MSWAPSIWKLGVTGGIGSGKSNVVKILSTFNVPVLDADKLGHAVYEKNSSGYLNVIKVFGQKVVKDDGEIDRAYLGSQVFGDINKMKQLTDIVWPKINELARVQIQKFEKEGHKLVVIEAAVMVEANWFDLIDELWVTTVPINVACQRIMERNTLSEEAALLRINSQISNEERAKYGDRVISTDRPKEDTQAIVTEMFQELETKLKNNGLEDLRKMQKSTHRL